MTITVTELEARAQEILNEVEHEGRVVEIARDGKVVARIVPVAEKTVRPWEKLYGSGKLLADPEESVWGPDPYKDQV